MQRSHLILVGTLIFLATLSSASRACAQTVSTGSIRGTVTDPSGAVVPAAEVNATNVSTGAQYHVKSQADGAYVIPLVPPGQYRLVVTHAGFSAATFEAVKVNVTENTILNVRLAVGSVTSMVEVTGAPLIVQTQSSALGEVVNEKTVESMPLSTRNYTQIINLSAGVASPVTRADAIGRGTFAIGTTAEGEGTFVHGARNYDNSFQIDGIDVNNSTGLGDIPVPNPDTIQEFKVQTGMYDAGYGRNAGASVDVVTKTGSNDFHGTLFEFWRNDVLNANDFFFNRTHTPKPALKQNQFGGTFGGPIVKDKLLFFGSYQGTRQINGVQGRQTILEPAFTDDRSAAALGQLFAGQRGLFQNVFGGVGPAIAADGSNINPVALKLLQMKLPDGTYLYPTPQLINPNAPFAQRGVASLSAPADFNENQYMANFDYLQSSKDTIEGRMFLAYNDTNNPLPGPGNIEGQTLTTNAQYAVASLTDTYIFTSNLFNQLRFGFNRTLTETLPHSVFTLSSLGVTTSPQNDDLAYINVLGSAVFGGNFESHSPLNRFDLRDDVSWVRGRHTFRFGGGLLRSQNNSSNERYWAQIQFPTWADFMLGLNGAQNGTQIFSNELVGVTLVGILAQPRRGWEGSGYAQDDFKVSSRLTLNLGVRYDWLPPEVYLTGRATNIDPSLLNANPPASGTYAGFTVPANYPKDVPAGVLRRSYNSFVKGNGDSQFSPRVGFAFKLLPGSDRLVLHGGYGIYRSFVIGNSQAQSVPSQPWVDFTVYSPPNNGGASWAHLFPEPIPPLSAFPSYFHSYSPSTALTGNLSSLEMTLAKTQQYTVDVQTQITSNTMLQVAWVGTTADHLLRSRGLNQANLASPSNPIRGQTTNTVSNIRLRVPYQGWSASALNVTESAGISSYNALEVTAKQRLSRGLQFLLSYTYSKALGSDAANVDVSSSAGGGSIGNQDVESARYGLLSYDRPHRFVASYIYAFSNFTRSPGFVNGLLSGWSVAGVTTFQAGRPLTITYTNSTNVYGITSDRASFAAGCNASSAAIGGSVNSRIDQYFKTSCFTAPAVIGDDKRGTGFGNTGIGILRGPDQGNFDLALIKDTRVNERMGIEFRAEFFNAFNATQFANPNTQFAATGFGAITKTSVAPRIGQLALKFQF